MIPSLRTTILITFAPLPTMPKSENTVTQYCRISKNTISKNGKVLFNNADEGVSQFVDSSYRFLKMSYPKFHKMDNLSKLGLLASDILLIDSNLHDKYAPFETGVVLSNKNSSLDTDIKYYDQVKKGVASPAVFVYSLPNIVIGEICIRNGIKGENSFFISDHFNVSQQVQYVNNLLETNVVKACICGWVELLGNSYDAFFYLVENSEKKEGSPFTIQTIEDLFNKKIE